MRVARRAAGLGLGLAGTAAMILAGAGLRWDAFVLTVTAAIGIINALWLEGWLSQVLQPGKPRFSRGSAGIVVGRMALWVVLFAVLFAIRDRFSVWSVVAGVGCFLVALAASGAGFGAGHEGEES